MSLRTRITLLSLAVTATFLALALGAQHLLHGYYADTLQASARRGMADAEVQLRERARRMQWIAKQCARSAWEEQATDIESFCVAKLPALLDREWARTHAALSDESGHVIWTNRPNAPFALGEKAFLVPDDGQPLHGFLDTPGGPAIAARSKVGSRDAALVLTLAQLLRPETLPAPVGVGFRGFRFVEPRPHAVMREDREHIGAILEAEDPLLIHRADSMHAYLPLADWSGRAATILFAAFEPPPPPVSLPAMTDALLWSLATVLVVTLALGHDLKRSIVRGIDWLSDQVSRVGTTGQGRIEAEATSASELKRLSGELTRMLRRLKEYREQTSENARVAGMSNVSMELLHSVGNVLNSVTVSASMVSRNMHRLGVGDLEMMIAELEEHRDDLGAYLTSDAYGRFLVPFLSEMTRSIICVRDDTLLELGRLQNGIRDVIDLVRSQDRYLGAVNILETVDLVEQVEVAINVCSVAREGLNEVQVERRFETHPRPTLDRHKLMGILINVISNALESLEAAGREDAKLTLRVYTVDESMFAIQVRDNGVGIPREDLTKAFNLGHTTKPDARGMGLHVAANSAAEMNGFLRGHSDGPGQGASFELFLPRSAPAAAEVETVDGVASLATVPVDDPAESPEESGSKA